MQLSAIQTYNERELLLRIAEDDEQAFRIVFNQHRDMVYAKALHFMKTPALAEDLLQDVFLRIWQHRNRLGEIEHFKAYLNTVSRNRIYSHFRKLASNSLLIERLDDQQQEYAGSETITRLEAKELQEALHNALELLTKQQRKVFELSRIKGLSHAEIAELLDMQRETVKKHITNALSTIRENLHRFPMLIQLAILLYL